MGAQKLAYQVSCREREATHGGPKIIFMKKCSAAGRQERYCELEMGI